MPGKAVKRRRRAALGLLPEHNYTRSPASASETSSVASDPLPDTSRGSQAMARSLSPEVSPDGDADAASLMSDESVADDVVPPPTLGDAPPTAPTRTLLRFPTDSSLTSTGAKYTWFAALHRQHPEAAPRFKEGRNAPYISLLTGHISDRLTTRGFNGVVLEPIRIHERTVLVHNVPTYVNVNVLPCPEGFLWIKRRSPGRQQTPSTQLIGAVIGQPPNYVSIFGLGDRHRVTPFVPDADLCRRCSRWGHKEWERRAPRPRCRYCAAYHPSEDCYRKIERGDRFTPKCCNCGGEHNAQSSHCPYKPRPHHTRQAPERPRSFQPAPPPLRNAWGPPDAVADFPALPITPAGPSAPAPGLPPPGPAPGFPTSGRPSVAGPSLPPPGLAASQGRPPSLAPPAPSSCAGPLPTPGPAAPLGPTPADGQGLAPDTHALVQQLIEMFVLVLRLDTKP